MDSSPPTSQAGTEGDLTVSPTPNSEAGALLRQILAGERPSIPPRFLYDELGSHLFTLITEVEDYYLTRTEAALFATHISAIVAARAVAGCTMIDLGAGNCAKAASLFDDIRPARYVAVDISVDFLEDALESLRRRFPAIGISGVGTDFSERLELPADVPKAQRLFFYPGSSIGNFSPRGAVAFLRSIRDAMGPDGTLWITADLDKDARVLERAYDDELGITAAFNRNLLNHVNRLAGTNFGIGDWRHVAHYDRANMRIEMHLEAVHEVTVRWPGGERHFRKGERIHTENSHKHTIEGFEELLTTAGLRPVGHWTDQRGWMAFFVAAQA